MKNVIMILVLIVSLGACNQKEEVVPATEKPVIVSLSSDKAEIAIGEVAVITCVATGDNLEYEWDVLLGDIIPVNQQGSVVNYSGSECCSGDKYITCTVRNDRGEVTEVIKITIIEE